MIIRTWRGRAIAEKQQAYIDHFTRNVLPELKSISGFRGAALLKREHGAGVEFLVQTRWESMDAIRRFAGADVTRAVVEPEAVAALSDYDTTVEHFGVVLEEM